MTGSEARPADPLLLVAAGGLAREVAAAARSAQLEVLGCLDDDSATWGQEIAPGVVVLGGLPVAAEHAAARLLVCAGKGSVREKLVARLEGLGIGPDRYATFVHPHASLSADTVVSSGAVILAGVVATADVVVGEHVVVMPNVVLTHDDRLEPYATLCAGVVLGGGVRVGRAAYVGMAASVRQGTSVGARALVGMGSVVLRDVGEGETWVGVPAAPMVLAATGPRGGGPR